jgi:hypothetical protein
VLNKLERSLGRFAIPHLITFLVAGQAGAFVLSYVKPAFIPALVLIPDRVLEGEVWRLVSFLFIPPDAHPIFIIFALMLLYTYGRALEEHWGELRFNLFVFVGWIATILAAFAVPGAVATNAYLMASLFLAFAYLYPDFVLRLFFILPVKIKWLAWLTWVFFAVSIVLGDWATRALVVAGVVNYFVFFGRDMWLRMRGASRRAARARQAKLAETAVRHRCSVCGITDVEDPNMQFRYCSQCDGKRGYCMDHIRDHEHVRA